MHILIVRNNSNSKAVDASLLLATYLATQGVDYTLVDSTELSCACDHDGLNAALAAGVEMTVVLGGDGTILRTARQIGTTGVPILGINFGRLGFLANSSDAGVVAIVAAALAGDVVAEQRANLRIDVVCRGRPIRGPTMTLRMGRSTSRRRRARRAPVVSSRSTNLR